jgi:histidyl-tRNA synthetase
MISRIKGTQDFLDLSLYNFIIDQAKDHFGAYHFDEISTPILEPVELFHRSLGEHTDVVTKEMFIIQKHAESSEDICLRPESTASTMRAFVENGVQITPWKVFSHGSMFRYERPQKGRFREFHQIDVEVIGAQSVSHDVQLITMLERFFSEKLQLDTFALAINYLGCASDREKYREKLYAFLTSKKAEGICDNCLVRREKNIMRVFDCKNPKCQEIYLKAPKIIEHMCDACNQEWKALQDQLQLLSVSFVVRPTLVRGLDYYSKTVFEFMSNDLGAQNTFCGGGRYDQLAKEFGAKQDYPSIGAALGLERLMLLLENKKAQLAITQPKAVHVIMPLAAAQHTLALIVADTLLAAGLCTDVLLEQDSIKSMMRQANRMGAAYALLLGETEQQEKTVTIKNMITGTQETIKQIELVNYLKR